MAKKKKILFPVLFMVLLTAVYTFVLAFINESSIELIKEQELLIQKKSVLYVFDINHDDSQEMINRVYNERLKSIETEDMTYYILEEANSIKGYAFPFTGKGLWGSISGYIALTPDFNKILGLDFTAHSETPGLGGRIDEEWFKAQFRNLDVSSTPAVIFRPSEGGNVDAITGATSTSKAVSVIINEFVTDIIDFAKEEALYEGNN
jgi:Na+-transporting NADH:ubiquinone oxidoreductase subunit C